MIRIIILEGKQIDIEEYKFGCFLLRFLYDRYHILLICKYLFLLRKKIRSGK